MSREKATVFSERLPGGRTSYFVDVRQAVNGRFYLTLTESRRNGESGFDQSRVFVFEEAAPELERLLGRAMGHMGRAVSERGPLPEPDVGPKTGSRWTEEEEEALRSGFLAGKPTADLASELGRSRRALEMRLEKLGLATAGEDRAG